MTKTLNRVRHRGRAGITPARPQLLLPQFVERTASTDGIVGEKEAERSGAPLQLSLDVTALARAESSGSVPRSRCRTTTLRP